jgi:hypothetical protein
LKPESILFWVSKGTSPFGVGSLFCKKLYLCIKCAIKGGIILILLISIIIALIILILASLLRGRDKYKSENIVQEPDKESQVSSGTLVLCPVCSSIIKKGDKIKTVAYSHGKEKITLIYGCPVCYPPKIDVKRICPVCKKELGKDGYLIGRMWEEKNKKHLHIYGCTLCKPNLFITG